MRKQSQQIMSEVQKVWYHVMNIIYRAGTQEARVPSSYELAKEFGIARSTVRIALEKLVDEGYLRGKRGAGTFTNPRKSILQEERSKPLVGLLPLSGNLFFYTADLQTELERFFGEFKRSGWNIRLITERMGTAEEARQVIAHSYLDGLIAFGSPEPVAKAASEMIPTVSMAFPAKGVATVYPVYRLVLEKLLELTGRSGDILVWTAVSKDVRDNFLLRDWKRPGIQILCNPGENVFDTKLMDGELKAVFSKRCPDWFVMQPGFLPQIRRIIIELYGEERARKCLWLFIGTPNNDPAWPGFFLQADRRSEIKKAIELLRGMMNGGKKQVQDFAIEAWLIRESDGVAIAQPKGRAS